VFTPASGYNLDVSSSNLFIKDNLVMVATRLKIAVSIIDLAVVNLIPVFTVSTREDRDPIHTLVMTFSGLDSDARKNHAASSINSHPLALVVVLRTPGLRRIEHGTAVANASSLSAPDRRVGASAFRRIHNSVGRRRQSAYLSFADIVALVVASHVVPASMEVLFKAVFAAFADIVGLAPVPGREFPGGVVGPLPAAFVGQVMATNPGTLALEFSTDSLAV